MRQLLHACNASLGDYPLPERVLKHYYLAGLESRLLAGTGQPRPRCVALTAHLRLLPNGEVPTCQFNTRAIGNLRQADFWTLWSSALANTQRSWVARCAGCWAECEVVPNAIYSADALRWALSARFWQSLFTGPRSDDPKPLSSPERHGSVTAEQVNRARATVERRAVRR